MDNLLDQVAALAQTVQNILVELNQLQNSVSQLQRHSAPTHDDAARALRHEPREPSPKPSYAELHRPR